MNYWKEKTDSHLRIGETVPYQKSYGLGCKINSEGYLGDVLQPSPRIFLGACDIASIQRTSWAEVLNTTLEEDGDPAPYIALASVGAGFPTMVRRLYSYIENFGPPKTVYMTVPRFDGREFVNSDGRCFNVSSRIGTANFCLKQGLIDLSERDAWVKILDGVKANSNWFDAEYLFRERFAFIETLCKLHKIELRWTFNLSDASIACLWKNGPVLADWNPFMMDSFVGMPRVKDHGKDRSIGPETQLELVKLFSEPVPYNFQNIVDTAKDNMEWLIETYGDDDLIMGENP